MTEQVAPHQVIASLSLEFEDHLTSDDIETCVNSVEAKMKQIYSEIVALFVKPQTKNFGYNV